MRDPVRYRNLQQEIRSKFSASKPITDSQLVGLPYLTACINEGLRLWPGLNGQFTSRVSTGAVVDGVYVPPGVRRMIPLPSYFSCRAFLLFLNPATDRIRRTVLSLGGPVHPSAPPEVLARPGHLQARTLVRPEKPRRNARIPAVFRGAPLVSRPADRAAEASAHARQIHVLVRYAVCQSPVRVGPRCAVGPFVELGRGHGADDASGTASGASGSSRNRGSRGSLSPVYLYHSNST